MVPTSDLHKEHAWQVHAGRKTQNRPRRMRQEPCRLGCPQGGSLAWFFFFSTMNSTNPIALYVGWSRSILVDIMAARGAFAPYCRRLYMI